MKYSYCPTVLGRVGLDHECGANAGNGKKKTVKNKKKLQDLKAHFHTYTTKQILTIWIVPTHKWLNLVEAGWYD